MNWDVIRTIFVILLLLSASALCIGLVIYLKKITKTVTDIGTDLKDLSFKIQPLIASTTNLTEKLNTVVQEVQEPINVAKDVVNDVKEKVDKILEMEEKIRGTIEKPVTDFSRNLSAILSGLNAFWSNYKKRSA